MPVLATESFSPAANPLSAVNWTTVSASSALQATGTACEPTTQSTTNRALYTNATWPNDQYSRWKMVAIPGITATAAILFVRSSVGTPANNYQVQINTLVALPGLASWKILKGPTTLSSGTLTLAVGDLLMLGVKGSVLTLYQNGTVLGTATDATLTSGTPGLGFLTVTDAVTDYKVSNWDGGSIVTAAAPTFSPVAGSYTSTQVVTLSSTTPNSTIYYTTDGSTPTTASANVPSGGTVSIAATATLKALALSNGPLDTASTETDGTYTISGGGDVYNPAIPFLGSVVVVAGAPAGDSDPFIGTVEVLAAAPAGLKNNFIGSIRSVGSAPSGKKNPNIGQVVVVSSAPAGQPNPYLGNAVEN